MEPEHLMLCKLTEKITRCRPPQTAAVRYSEAETGQYQNLKQRRRRRNRRKKKKTKKENGDGDEEENILLMVVVVVVV
jgi:hypothetical protein